MFAMDASCGPTNAITKIPPFWRKFLADETGGDAYISQNDINKGIEKGTENKRLLPDRLNRTMRRLTPRHENSTNSSIKLKRPDLKLSYRSGFGVESSKAPVRPAKPFSEWPTNFDLPFRQK